MSPVAGTSFNELRQEDTTMSDEPTRFIEANALLAIQSGDRLAAMTKLAEMHPHELRELGDAAYELGDMCRAHEREKRLSKTR